MERLEVNINDESAEILRRVMAEKGISATEATRQAIGLLGFMEEQRREGNRVIVEKPGGKWQVR
jgi:hypothetical protein